MSPSDVDPNSLSAKSKLRDALKVVPSAIVLSALWFILLRYAFDRWHLVAPLPPYDRSFLANILAVPLALITYFFGNYWDDHVFDPRYTEDPYRRFRGKWLDTSRRNCFGLLPAGRDLDLARKQAAHDLKLKSVEGVYAKAKAELKCSEQWAPAERLLFLSKLCRNLIWPFFLIAAAFTAQVVYALFTRRTSPIGMNVLEVLVAFVFGMFLFVPYINLRVEHMLEMYRQISTAKTPPNPPLQPTSGAG